MNLKFLVMNIVKNLRKRICSIVYIDKPSEEMDNMIVNLYNHFDVYVYINKKSKINPLRYSSLIPINGYISGSYNEVEGLIEVIKYIHSVIPNYYSFYIPNINDYVKSSNDIDILLMKGMLSASIFKSNEVPFDVKMNTYSETWMDSISFLRDKRNYGMNSTHTSEGSIILMFNDIEKITRYLSEDKGYLDTFKYENMNTFVPSIFNKLEIDHINLSIQDVLDKPFNNTPEP
jgi:hypothetical protein